MSVEPQINLLLDLGPEMELARWRRRALFLTSVFLHIFLIMFIIYAPDLLRRGKLMMGIPVTPRPEPANYHLVSPPGFVEVAAPATSGSAPFRQEPPSPG